MLVLSRERGETVNIGDEIEITVIDIRGDKVRLGVSAPRHVAVHRKPVGFGLRGAWRGLSATHRDRELLGFPGRTAVPAWRADRAKESPGLQWCTAALGLFSGQSCPLN